MFVTHSVLLVVHVPHGRAEGTTCVSSLARLGRPNRACSDLKAEIDTEAVMIPDFASRVVTTAENWCKGLDRIRF
jgi:hypothetical protein